MDGAAYAALSGIQVRLEQLDRLAADIANVQTAGYKSVRGSSEAAERDFDSTLRAAIDVTRGGSRIDFRGGAVVGTGRDLDVAIEGSGFFTIETPDGPRYTRNGHFSRRADGVLTTAGGSPVLGEGGPIRIGLGISTIDPDGTVRTNGAQVERLRVVDFDDYRALVQEGASEFRAAGNTGPARATAATLRSGALEQSNVSLPERMVELTEAMRGFEALQRGIGVLTNDLDARAISELGRR